MLAAKRYAEALIKLGQEEGKLEIFYEQLFKMFEIIKNNNEFNTIWFDLEMKRSEKKQRIKVFFGGNIDSYILNLLYLLIDKRREIILPYIPFYYKEIYDKIAGNVDVQVIVAHEIGSDVLNKISKWLLKKYGVKNPRFIVKVDKSIIGGIKLLFNNIEVDASIKGALDSMRKELVKIAIL
jgi:F-type H+-transporting ATPase subunit delta